MLGDRFGRLVVVGQGHNGRYDCLCDCGTSKSIRRDHIRRGNTKSCGCLRSEEASKRQKVDGIKHGLHKHPLYAVLQSMRQRCFNENDGMYFRYGGRGISVCDKWVSSFVDFYEWCMANGYKKGLQIDRINNNGNYEPSNCRFVTCRQNLNNREKTVLISYLGSEYPISVFAELHGINRNTLRNRLLKGMTVHEAINTPVKRRRGNLPKGISIV